MTVVAVYPGSFDPLTNGHIDLIERAAKIFDRLIVAVVCNPGKTALFTDRERRAMIEEVLGDLPNVTADVFEGLLVDYARRVGASVLVRGLRAISDFEFEFQMTLMNRQQAPEVETIFLMPRQDFTYLSSSLVKEVAALGGSVTHFVPPAVERRLRERLKR